MIIPEADINIVQSVAILYVQISRQYSVYLILYVKKLYVCPSFGFCFYIHNHPKKYDSIHKNEARKIREMNILTNIE